MEAALVDTTVGIDYLNGNQTQASDLLHQCLQNQELVLICPTIIQEILQGIKEDADFDKIKNLLATLFLLETDAKDAAVNAANIYRTLRKKGITIIKSADCLIAFTAIYYDVALLHNDKDFDTIYPTFNLSIHPLSKT